MVVHTSNRIAAAETLPPNSETLPALIEAEKILKQLGLRLYARSRWSEARYYAQGAPRHHEELVRVASHEARSLNRECISVLLSHSPPSGSALWVPVNGGKLDHEFHRRLHEALFVARYLLKQRISRNDLFLNS